MIEREPSKPALVARGCALVAGLAAASVLSAAAYMQVFTPTEKITLLTDRSGLLMEPGSDVKVAGVVVGKVDEIRRTDNHVELTLAMKPDQLTTIPADSTAVIEPTTLFGRKFVTLVPPENPGRPVEPDDVIDSSEATVEMNDLFTAVDGVLEVIDPSQVNVTLTQLASAADGRGETFGRLLESASVFLTDLEPVVPALTRDIGKVADNADIWTDAANDYLGALERFTTTGQTLVDREPDVAAFIQGLTHLSDRGAGFLDIAGQPIIGAANDTRSTLELLEEKSPALGCFLYGLDTTRQYLEPTLGGTRPGFNVASTLLYGDPPYRTSENLPRNTADGPPDCYEETYVGGQQPAQTDFADGSGAYHREMGLAELANSPLWQLLYGPNHLFSGE